MVENCVQFVFLNNMEILQVELALFSVEKACGTSDVIPVVCTRIDNSYGPISVWKF